MLLFGEIRRKLGWYKKTAPKDPLFLSPTSGQFPFDGVCGDIVRELEKKKWRVPGISVEFHDYGSGDQKFRMVSSIKSDDFNLRFCRKQQEIPGGRWNDIAAVTEISIPKKEIHVYEDESGPTFYLYVGKDWEKDRKRFNGLKVHSKMNGEPKVYLEYKGGCDCRNSRGAAFEGISLITAILGGDHKSLQGMRHTHPGHRSPLLVHTNDLNREYDPEGDEPKFFRTDEVMEEFIVYLEEVVLNRIISSSEPENTEEPSPKDPIPFPDSIGPLFCFGEYRDSERIKWGRTFPDKLQPADRYGLSGGGYRLAFLGVPNDGTLPEIAYDGFRWLGIGKVNARTPISDLEVPGHCRWSDRERFVIRVTPDRCDGVYIADHAEYEARRKELGDVMEEGRDTFTDEEVNDFTRARARTIIPISDYKGDYKKPVVLINRELSFDEVEIISGPHEDL